MNMVALMLLCTSYNCKCVSRVYKVKDSNEDDEDYSTSSDSSRSLFEPKSSNGFDSSSFDFHDFFNDGLLEKDSGSTGFSFVSPFDSPFSVSESGSSDSSTFLLPAGTFRSRKFNGKSNSALTKKPYNDKSQFRSSKRPITTLYDDWRPEEDKPRFSAKWSQEHPDSSSDELPVPYNNPKATPSRKLKNSNGYSRPYSEASLKQHYKHLRPPSKTYGVNYPPKYIGPDAHTHKYGISHYAPRKSPYEPKYNSQENLHSTKPQQFNNELYHRQHNNKPQGRSYRGNPRRNKWNAFEASPPDLYLNSRADNFNYYSDSSSIIPKHAPANSDSVQLDKSCIKNNRSTTINLSEGSISVNCYDCYDSKHSRPYEQCVEANGTENKKETSSKRVKRELNVTTDAVPSTASRDKRQYDDYQNDGDVNYGPDSSDYRFGPEHFTDDYSSPSSYDNRDDYTEGDGENIPDYESEKCYKSRKGNMLCISCENKNTGGTYKQCSYASDPKKKSYERSVSKVYGSPRLPEENRRKQYDRHQKPTNSKPINSRRAPQERRPERHSEPHNEKHSEQYYEPPSSSEVNSPRNYRGKPSYRNVEGPRREKPHHVEDEEPPMTRYKGSQGRLPLPIRGGTRERSAGRPPPKYHTKSSPDTEKRSHMSSRNSGSGPPKPLEKYRYHPSNPPPPPPASRAYSTPSPVHHDHYSYDIPDPYSPDHMPHMDEVDPIISGRNRKTVDLYEPGYDETFATLFPELSDADPILYAPSNYDEYPEGDYDTGPERRTDEPAQVTDKTKTKSIPPPHLSSMEYVSKDEVQRKRDLKRISNSSSCKKVKKDKMTCLRCVDDKGTRHEECQYVENSEPRSKHATYQEIKEARYSPKDGLDNTQQGRRPSYTMTEPQNEEVSRGKRKFKKYEQDENDKLYFSKEMNTDQGNDWQKKPGREFQKRIEGVDKMRSNVTGNEERKHSQERRYKEDGEIREKREGTETPVNVIKTKDDTQKSKTYDPIPTDPPELEDMSMKMSEHGEFKDDLRSKFDPVLGLSLPKYMVEKSEHEAIFDEMFSPSIK